MDKREACHKLADINESMYDLENMIQDLKSRASWDDDYKTEGCRRRIEDLENQLQVLQREHDDFINQYSDIIYS